MNLITLLYNNRDQYVSGQWLSEKLNMTRAGIWKQIKSLQNQGVDIQSSQSLGYKLISTNHFLDPILLNSLDPELTVEYFTTLPSTNDYAKTIAAKPALIIAKEQTQGKGRRGKSFFSPKNHGLYFSYILKEAYNPQAMAFITIKAAVALQQTIQSCFGIDSRIKWLNDLYIGDKKIAGILVEGSIELQTQVYEQVIIGIGLNLTRTQVPDDIEAIYQSLNLENYDLHEFLIQFIKHFNALTPNGLIETYKSLSMIIGREVVNSNDQKTYRAIDIDDDGALILESIKGETLRLNYGEVSLKVK